MPKNTELYDTLDVLVGVNMMMPETGEVVRRIKFERVRPN